MGEKERGTGQSTGKFPESHDHLPSDRYKAKFYITLYEDIQVLVGGEKKASAEYRCKISLAINKLKLVEKKERWVWLRGQNLEHSLWVSTQERQQ